MKGILHEPGGGVKEIGLPMSSIVNKLDKINASNI